MGRVRPGRHPGRRGGRPRSGRAGRRAGRGGHRRRHGRAGHAGRRPRRRPGSGSSRSTCSPPPRWSGPRCPTSRRRRATSSRSPPRSASRRSATPRRTARRSSAWSVSPGRSPPSWPGSVGVTLLIPGGMRTAFFDDRDPQYKPGPDAKLNDPADTRRRGHVRAAASRPAARCGSWWSAAEQESSVTRDPRAARARRRRPAHRGARPCVRLRAGVPGERAGAGRARPGWRRWSTWSAASTGCCHRRAWPGRDPGRAAAAGGRGQPARPRAAVAPAAARPRRPAGGLRCPPSGHRDGPALDATTSTRCDRWCRLLGAYGVAGRPRPIWGWPAAPGRRAAPAVTSCTRAARSRRGAGRRTGSRRVARRLAERGHRVVVTGRPAERDWPTGGAAAPACRRRRAGRADRPGRAGRAGGRTPGWWSAGTPASRHLATAYGTPSVLLFGPMSPARWGPPRTARGTGCSGTAGEPSGGPPG